MYKDLEDELWESLLKAAVIKNSQNEIKDYPSEQEINRIVLPEHYESRMRRILRRYRYRKYAKLSLRYGKKIASVILLIMGISFTLLLSFDEVRAACEAVIIEIYDRYIRYSYTSDLSLENAPISLGYVPEGYSIAEISFNGIDNYVSYQNAYGDFIIVEFDVQKFAILVDNERYSTSEELICNNKGTFFESGDSDFLNILIWTTENGYFQLRSALEKKEMIKIAENIK